MKKNHSLFERKFSFAFSLPGKKSKLSILFLISFFTIITTSAQVKIGNNPNTINANSLLELEGTDKGFLPPRVELTDLTSVSPLTGTVPAGMLVYNSGNALAKGFYFWNGSSWKQIGTAVNDPLVKTANATLTKTERLILASNDITITLPQITIADDGLEITIKNVGTHTDLVTLQGYSGALIDNVATVLLPRWYNATVVAKSGAWILKHSTGQFINTLEVSASSSWQTLQEAIEFLETHMTAPSIIVLRNGNHSIAETIVIDLPHSLTIEGATYGTSIIEPASGLGNTPMFRCLSETYFKKLAFDGTALANYGNNANQDAIQLEGEEEYYEIKDCSFEHFNKTVVIENNAELWMFEVDIKDAVSTGIEVSAGTTSGVTMKISEVDFINCATGVNLSSGADAVISILNSGFYNATGGIGVNYVPGVGNFHNFSSMFITNNSWNNVGTFFNGFDFSRTDGRDSKAFLQNNAGDPDRSPRCYLNVLNSATTTSLTSGSLWYKANWNHAVTTVTTSKWTVANASGNVNRITYQQTNKKDGYFIISGNLSCSGSNQTISLGIVKNNATGTRLGETTIRTGNSNTPTLFSTTVYLTNISKDDYFELFVSNVSGGTTVTIQDLQWFADTK